MAPQRPLLAPEDSRSDASSTKERQIAALPIKPRRNGNAAVAVRNSQLRDVTAAPTTLNVEEETQHDIHDNSGTVRQCLSFSLNIRLAKHSINIYL